MKTSDIKVPFLWLFPVIMNMNSSSNGTSSGDNLFLGASYLIVSVLVITSNSVVVIVIFKSRELHMPPLWMIAFMASWDLALGVFFLLIAAPSTFLNYFPYPDSLIPVAACMLVLIGCQNGFNVCMVYVDRYLAIRFPMKYPRIAVTRNYLLVILSLMLNVSPLLIIMFTVTKFYLNTLIWLPYADQKSAAVTFITGCVLIIPFSTVIGCSVPVYKNIKHASKRITSQGAQSASSKDVLRFPLMVLLCAAAYCLSYIPVIVTIFWKLIYGHENVNVFRFAIFSWFSNSLWNIVIYVGTYKPFKVALTRLFCKAYYRRQRRASMFNMFQTRPPLREPAL